MKFMANQTLRLLLIYIHTELNDIFVAVSIHPCMYELCLNENE